MAGIRNRGDSGFSTCSAALCTATVSLQAASHSLSHHREEVAAVVISGTSGIVPMPAFGGAYSDVDPPCQLRHLGLRQQGVGGHRPEVAELGTNRSMIGG